MKRCRTVLVCLGLTVAFSSNTYATNGYFSHGYGAKSKSMGGSCVAMTFSAMCGMTNPGTLAMMGNRLDYGLAFFKPERGFTANNDASATMPPASIAPGTYESDNDWFLIPNLAYNRMLDDNTAIGLFVAANGGMNTEYNTSVFKNFSHPSDPSTSASSPTGADLMQMFVGLTYSRKITAEHAVGIAPILAIQSFEAQGLQPFKPFSLYPDKVTNNGADYAYGGGIRIGWLGKLDEHLTVGASYQTKMWMGEFDDYKGLLAEEGSFDIPATYNLGVNLLLMPKLNLAVEYQRIEYSGVKAVSNPANLVFMPGETLLGTANGLGFGWEDMNILKVGLQWQYSPNLTLRMGYSHANNPIPSDQTLFNIIAPAVIQNHYTLGFSTPLSKKVDFDVTFTYAPNEKVHGMNPNTGPQTGSIEMSQYELAVSWGIWF
jgi:long-chain fatty acid transport protein